MEHETDCPADDRLRLRARELELARAHLPADLRTLDGHLRKVVADAQPVVSERDVARQARDAAAAKTRTLNILAAQLGDRYGPAAATLERFRPYHPRQAAVLATLRTVAADIEGFVAANRGLIFLGAVGTGKDHLLAAMLWAAAQADLSAQWVNGQDVYGAFRDGMDTGRREEELLQKLTAPTVLGISDPVPAIGAPSPWNVQQLYRLIDRRYRLCRSTWVTLNAADEAAGADALSSAVWDRLRDGAEVLHCFWGSYRTLKKEERR